MRHYVITNRLLKNRNSFAKEGNNFSSTLHYGYADIDDATGEVTFDIIGEDKHEEIDFNYSKIKTNASGLASFFKELYHEMRNEEAVKSTKNDIMFFIHGYGHNVEKSMRFLAQLHRKYVLNKDSSVKKIVMFMWPSKAHHVVSYMKERNDAEISGQILGKFYQRLKQFNDQYAAVYEAGTELKNRGFMHLLVQSMGNKVLQKMFQTIYYEEAYLHQSFKEIIMVGADLEDNILQPGQPLELLPQICARVHLYIHKGDFALWISKLFNWIGAFRNRNPLGKFGPVNINEINGKVKVVDVTKVEKFISYDNDSTKDFLDDNLIQHRYFMYSTEVIEDITEVMRGIPSEKMKRDVKIEARWFTLPYSGN
ncbi:MAG: alpha/beta hydrolase [Bacteroidetes bacterium]|nr:alpha/beta hydrolase [Bacteroidota bacterium]MBK9800886.1 alpha/beta hydrolase [Bacteroidota bacterium]MBP6412030.1 alpha/beta hydrolase [Bacteroidia bacterium]